MMISHLNTYIASALSHHGSTPAMMDESSVLLFLSGITGNTILTYTDLSELNITNVSLYDIPEEKKEFNIETVRGCIVDIELKPYEGKHIYILRHFSTATIHAQNALLKILEECPEYAVIILEVESPNSVLETIKSRVIDLTNNRTGESIDPIRDEIIQLYTQKEYKKLSQILYSLKCSNNEAISILQGVYPYLSEEDMDRCSTAIESLISTHENPRSVLDVFFL